MNLPNILTLIRFALVPVMGIFLMQRNFTVAIIIYVLASVTDILDGYIARKYNQITNFGKILDPLADKLLQFTAIIGLWVLGIIPFWIPPIFFLKEMLMGLGCIKLLRKDIIVPSKWFGKLSTVLLFLAIIASMLSPSIPILQNYTLPLFILAIISLFFSFIMYLINYINQIKKSCN
ncbi:MAG: CDP-diacylglycerol--glycerol-3-phosphate 3-phosphatidyltransferase [Clostridia bacterium]|nr:CDP-diacylglycerol--glycerol-3-phosphate 3-phosphatidyltransferase [Clostridia bacterium]